MRPPTTPLLLLCLAILVSTAAAIPPAFVAPLPGRRRQNHQPLLFRQPSRGVVVLSSSSPQKEDVSKMEAGKPGPGGQPLSLTTANATAAAFELLVDTIQNWAVVIEDRQELSKGTCALLYAMYAVFSDDISKIPWKLPFPSLGSFQAWRSSHSPLNNPHQKKLTEEIIDRLDEWMHKVNGDQRMILAALKKLNKDVNRLAILVVVWFGVSLATIAPTWFAAK